MLLPILVFFCLSFAMDVPSAEAYVSNCVARNAPIALETFWKLPGTLTGETSPHVLALLEDDAQCVQVKKFKEAGHVVTPHSVMKLASLYPSLDTFRCTSDIFAINVNEFPEFAFKTSGKSLYQEAESLISILTFIQNKGKEISPFELSALQFIVRKSPGMMRMLTNAGYRFNKITVEVVMTALFNGTSYDKDMLYAIYEDVNDEGGLWIDQILERGAKDYSRLLDNAVASGFDNNIRCVLDKQPTAICRSIFPFKNELTNGDSPLVQEEFRKILAKEQTRSKYFYISNREHIASIIFRKPGLMPVLYDLRKDFFDSIEDCELLMQDAIIEGYHEGPAMFLEHGNLEIGSWIFDGLAWHNFQVIAKFIAQRNQLNSVKSRKGLYALHLACSSSKRSTENYQNTVKYLIDAGANVNLMDESENRPTTPLQYALGWSTNPDRRQEEMEAIKTLLIAGAEYSLIGNLVPERDLAYRRILARARWEQCGRYLVLGLNQADSLMCGDGFPRGFLVEAFYFVIQEYRALP